MSKKKAIDTKAPQVISQQVQPKKNGRPSSYKPEYDDMLIAHMSEGLSFESFSAVIKVNQDTLHSWVKQHVSFAEAKSIAFDESRLFYERIGTMAVKGLIENFNATVWVFNMKNRFKWRDKQPEEVSQVNISIDKMSDAELEKIIKEAAEKIK